MKTEDELNLNEEVLGEPDLEPAPEGEPTPEGESTPDEKLLRVTVRATGKQYVGKTERDIMSQMEEDMERMHADAATRDAQAREVRGKVQYQQERQGEQWDAQKYLNLLGTDPMEARRYQDRHYYGMGEDEDPAEAVRHAYTFADKMNDVVQMADFQRMNKGPDGKPLQMSEDDAKQFLIEFDRRNLVPTALNFTAVYRDMISRGQLKEAAVPTNAQYEDIELKPKSRGEGAPRGTGGAGPSETRTRQDMVGGKTMAEIEAMPKPEFDKFMRKLGILQH